MSAEVQQVDQATVSVEDRQTQQNTKVQNKIVNFIEQNTRFSKSRTEFVELNKTYRELPAQDKPVESVQVVEKKFRDNKGNEVSVLQDVKRKVFPNSNTESLFNVLKSKRKDILRFNKQATVYVNMLCDKITEDMISSCQPLNKGKKSQEKTLSWKQFGHHEFKKRFTYSLVCSSSYFDTFIDLRRNVKHLDQEKEMNRFKYSQTKAQTTTIHQDIQRYKQLKNLPDKTPEEVERLIDEEFDQREREVLSGVYEALRKLLAEDEESKLLFNGVKNVTKQHQVTRTGDDSVSKLKISNGFKNLVSKVIRQTLMVLAYKVESYLEGNSNHQIRLEDIKKILRLWASFYEVDDLKKQLDEFDASVDQRISEINSAKHEKKSNSSSSSSSTPAVSAQV